MALTQPRRESVGVVCMGNWPISQGIGQYSSLRLVVVGGSVNEELMSSMALVDAVVSRDCVWLLGCICAILVVLVRRWRKKAFLAGLLK